MVIASGKKLILVGRATYGLCYVLFEPGVAEFSPSGVDCDNGTPYDEWEAVIPWRYLKPLTEFPEGVITQTDERQQHNMKLPK